MARIELNQITHTYDTDVSNPTYALEEFSITWEDGGRYAKDLRDVGKQPC